MGKKSKQKKTTTAKTAWFYPLALAAFIPRPQSKDSNQRNREDNQSD